MAARLLIAAGMGLAMALPVNASPWHAGNAGLHSGIDEISKDAIRNQVIQNYFQAPHATNREPDAQRVRNQMRLPNETDVAKTSGGLDSADVQLFFAENTPLGIVIDTLARSLGYQPHFVAPWVRGQLVPHAIRGEHEVADVVAWLTERMHIPITIFPESRLIMVYGPRGS